MPDLLREVLAAWWRFLPAAAVQAAVLLLAVAALERLLPRRTPAELREALWWLALAKLVLPPGFASPIGWTVLLPAGWTGWLARPASVPEGVDDPAPWAAAVVAVWALGAVAMTVAAAVRSARLRRRLARIRQPAEPGDRRALERAAATLGIARSPKLYRLAGPGLSGPGPADASESAGAAASPFVVGPALRGTGRAAIYLPAALAAGEVEHVLLHELAHLARRDGARRLAAFVLHAAYWFHPLLPLARRRLALLAEPACDRLAARALGAAAGEYRRTLLTVARRALESSLPDGGAVVVGLGAPGQGFLSPPSIIRLRLEAIASAAGDRPLRRRLAIASVAALALVAVLPMAAWGESASRRVADLIERPPGCLQLRYLVFQQMAREAAEAPPATDSEGVEP